MSVVGKRYTLINVCEELSGDKITIVFPGAVLGKYIWGGGGWPPKFSLPFSLPLSLLPLNP